MTTDRDTFVSLCRFFNAEPDGSGNVWVTCPLCGRGDRRFSFHLEKGAHCFRCDGKLSLKQLADKVLGEGYQAPPGGAFSIKPPKVRAWQRKANDLADSFTQTPGRYEAWRAYKPLPASLIDLYHLGYGVFPGLCHTEGRGEPDFIARDGTRYWGCHHPRLIVPLYADGQVVGFRCRSVACDCPRWLSPAGSKLVLYNGACLLPRDARTANLKSLLGDSSAEYVQGHKLIIAENPIDAIWAQHNWGVLGVGTLGVSIWKPGWTKILAVASPGATLVAFDNDLAGNGGGPSRRALEAAWRTTTGHPAPEPAGIKRVRDLQKAKVRCRLHDWGGADVGADLGDLLKSGALLPDFTPQLLPGIERPKSHDTLPLVTWFVTEYLGRPMRPEDYRGSHMAHAKQLLQTYTIADLQGCLLAVKRGVLDCPWEVTYLTQLTKGEPPLLAQWRAYCETPPPGWKTAECELWRELTGRVLPTEDPWGDDPVPMWPPGMRPEAVAAEAG